ncbi:DNA primase large subunit [Nasonia vitripennis]|uniref:DNA primase large subunit n=1 Tax=Nasonia vitripennis TaxID=7425 RepID=A0A7M7H7Y6_NASVI|nr:DNA primase large subunit [Nasonia vitripennis]
MFYIQPPKGLVTLHTLEEIVFSRVEYLNALDNEKDEVFNGKFEYLLEGSPHDYVGHFTLRLITSKSNESFSQWLSKEILLLKKRLSLIHPRQLFRLLKTIRRHVRRRENCKNPVDDILIEISSFYLTPKAFKHIISKHHSKNCTKYYHKIDFVLIPDLVEERSVELYRGFATVYCSQWKDLLQSLFQTFIVLEMKNQSALMHHLLADPRLDTIHRKLFHGSYTKSYSSGKITALNIDNEAFNFPPCMYHLHLELRRKHRLSHYARFYYTLFLKECGMNLEDALIYWKNEYSKPHSCTSLCVHDWQTDAKKFTYSIRHMYGLEGGRKNYKTPNCRGICEQVPGSNYEGGCPFSNFDTDSLRYLLQKSINGSELDQIMAVAPKQKPQDTCANFFKLKSATCVSDITITKPVQYYLAMRDLN